MVKWIWLLLICTNLFSADLIDIYRKHGIHALEEAVQKELQSPDYWRSFLADKDTRYGLIENYRYLLVGNKSKPDLKLLEITPEGLKELGYSDTVIVGGAEGDKEREGDLRTPIGVYELNAKLTKLDPYYGPMAFTTSYPNLLDRLQGKNGSGIWIHGVPENGEREANTRGCIALENNYIRNLDGWMEYQNTVLIVGEEKIPEVEKEDLVTILSSVYQWREAWKESDLSRYLSFYHPEFRRFDGKSLEEFSNMKRTIFNRGGQKKIVFKNFDIFPYPNLEGHKLFRINFDEVYETPGYQFEGKKELYAELQEGKLLILAEK